MPKASTPQIKLGKNGRPIIPNANPAGAQPGWRGGIGKGPTSATFTARRTGKRGDK